MGKDLARVRKFGRIQLVARGRPEAELREDFCINVELGWWDWDELVIEW